MSAIHFTTVIGPDGVIRPPAGVTLPEGEVEVAVHSKAADDPMAATRSWLLALAAEVEADPAFQNLPPDLAENHDHYIRGAPKR